MRKNYKKFIFGFLILSCFLGQPVFAVVRSKQLPTNPIQPPLSEFMVFPQYYPGGSIQAVPENEPTPNTKNQEIFIKTPRIEAQGRNWFFEFSVVIVAAALAGWLVFAAKKNKWYNK